MLGDGAEIGSPFFSTTTIRCTLLGTVFTNLYFNLTQTVRALFHCESHGKLLPLYSHQLLRCCDSNSMDRNGNQYLWYKVVSIQIWYKLKQWNYCHYFKYSLCQVKNDPCSCECNLCNCMWSLKKFRTSTGFKPVDLAIPLQHSNQLLKLWSHPTYSNPVEVLNFSQASLHNCINCVHCDNHFFIFISFPQFIYDLFHISLAL